MSRATFKFFGISKLTVVEAFLDCNKTEKILINNSSIVFQILSLNCSLIDPFVLVSIFQLPDCQIGGFAKATTIVRHQFGKN